LNIEVTHSERLMSTVDQVLRATGLTIGDMDGFAVAIGPGSFTGLRIGLSTVKGLALVTGKPIAAVPTLEALAWNLPYADAPVCPMLDARKNEVYAAVYEFRRTGLAQLMPETALPIKGLSDVLTGDVIFSGEASRLYRSELEKQFRGRARFAPLAALLPSAAAVAELGLSMLATGRQAAPDSLTPLYVRRPEAEVAWEKRQSSQ
jgi:tRNA threonylcarbamoyladenosine biosynthesis protein TsaB